MLLGHLATMHAAFGKGQQVDVFSQGQGKWIAAIITQYADAPCVIDSYSIPAGGMKVIYPADS